MDFEKIKNEEMDRLFLNKNDNSFLNVEKQRLEELRKSNPFEWWFSGLSDKGKKEALRHKKEMKRCQPWLNENEINYKVVKKFSGF